MGVFWGGGDEPGLEPGPVQKARHLMPDQMFRLLSQRSSDGGRRAQDLEKRFRPQGVHFFSQTVLKITT
jgi:hypothetical protein